MENVMNQSFVDIIDLVVTMIFNHFLKKKEYNMDEVVELSCNYEDAFVNAVAYSIYRSIIGSLDIFTKIKKLRKNPEDAFNVMNDDIIIDFMAKYEIQGKSFTEDQLQSAQTAQTAQTDVESQSSDSDFSELSEITGIDMTNPPREINKVRHINFKKVYAYYNFRNLTKKELTCELPSDRPTENNTQLYQTYYYNPEYFSPYNNGNYIFKLIKN